MTMLVDREIEDKECRRWKYVLAVTHQIPDHVRT